MMKRLFMSILFGGMFAGMVSGGTNDSVDLSAYHWRNRLLFLFAPSEEDPPYLSLKSEIEHQANGVLDRDLLVVHVPEKGEGRFGKERLSPGQVLALWKHLSASPGQFTTILVGKDGGEKFRQTGIIRLEEIFQIIDAMPMRQQEMKKK